MIEQTGSWLAYTEFSHTGPQGAAIEAKELGGSVFSADFPFSLLKNPNNMFALNRIQGFLA